MVTPRRTIASGTASSASALPMPFCNVTSAGLPTSVVRSCSTAEAVAFDFVKNMTAAKAVFFSEAGSLVAAIRTVRGFFPIIRSPWVLTVFACSPLVSNAVTLATDDNAAAQSPPIAPQPTMRMLADMISNYLPRQLRWVLYFFLIRSDPNPYRIFIAQNLVGSCSGSFLNIGQGEAGDLFVTVGKRSQLILRDVFVEIVEWFVANQFLDLDIDEIRRLFAIGAHQFGCGRNTRRFIGLQGRARVRPDLQQIGQRSGIDCCLRGTVRTPWIHPMRSVAG